MATISIADNDARVQYTQAVVANTTQLTIDFPFFSLDDINVIVTSAAGVDTTLTRGTGTGTFAVTGTSVDDGYSGGYITLGDNYTDSSTKYTIFRDIDVERTTDFPTSGPFNIGSLNTELDKIFAINQELETKIGRTMKLADSDSAAELSLPNLDTRKGTVLAFNTTTGLPEAGPEIGDVSTIAAITADISTLADIEDGTDATDAIQTVASISSNVTTVAGISSNVSTVAGISSDVSAVASDATDIGTVSTNIANVNTVAGQTTNMQNVTDNLTAIQNAATNATNAATSASNAATSESNAASSASSASSAQTAAEAARDSALAAYDNFDDRYLGVKASDPTVDNDGDALVAGSLYFNSTDGAMKLYNGSAWVAAYVSGADYLALTGGTMTGDVTYGDNVKAIFGAGNDLAIYHSGTNSIIEETSGAGSLIIKGTNISFEDGTGAETYATFIKDNAVTLRYDNATKLTTTSSGIDVTGTVTADGVSLGDSEYIYLGASNDIQIYHDGSNSFLKDAGTGSLRICGDELKFLNAGDNQLKLTADTNGAVKLYYSGTEKVATTTYGLDISGSVVADTQTASVTGSQTPDFDTYQNFLWTLTGNITLANPTTEKQGQTGFFIFIHSGGARTVSLQGQYGTAGGAGLTLSGTAGAVDIVPYVVRQAGFVYLGTPQLAFA